MVSCSVAADTTVPPNREWTAATPAMLRDSMLRALDGWHPAARGIVERLELESMFSIPFGFLAPPEPWPSSRVTLIGDAAHAMLPTLGMGANLSLRDAGLLSERLAAVGRGEQELIKAIAGYEADMREVVYPIMRMAMEHDKHFGGGALEQVRPGAEGLKSRRPQAGDPSGRLSRRSPATTSGGSGERPNTPMPSIPVSITFTSKLPNAHPSDPSR